MAYILDSWETIADNCAKGFAKTLYKLGDLKTITVTLNGVTEQIDMEIVGFSHDDMSNGNGKAAITFFSKQLLKDYRQMNTANQNTGGWAGQYSLRNWCNNDLFNALPTDLQSVIKEVKKLSDGGQNSSVLVETNDKVWFASAEEINYDVGGWLSTTKGQGARYPQSKNHDSGIDGSWLKKAKTDGTVYHWWLRTSAINDYRWSFILQGGGCNYDVGIATFGIAFGFCVGEINAISAVDNANYSMRGTRMIQIADQVRRIRGITSELTPAQIVSELAQIPDAQSE